MNLENFKTYTTDDFILDEEFRKIIQESQTDGLGELMKTLPEKSRDMKLAAKILREMRPRMFHQPEDRQKELWQQILREQKNKIRILYFSYAASFLLLVGIGSAIFFLSPLKKEEPVVASTLPSNDAVLILADGEKVAIDSKQSTVQYSADGSEIKVNNSSEIAQPASGKGMNEMIVPYGKRSYIMLSEGTKVWLNSGSKLTFPPAFKGKTREVTLEGEAFFDVAKDPERPFFVKTEAFKMKVYGTKFNIQAYSQEKDFNIVLVEGKVSMNANKASQTQEVFLVPNQKASISKGDKDFEITQVENIEVYTAWIDGYLTFINEDVSVLLKKVSRYYNVEIEVKPGENMEKIYGKLDLKNDLERVLDGIAFISKTKYEKQGNKYVFMCN